MTDEKAYFSLSIKREKLCKLKDAADIKILGCKMASNLYKMEGSSSSEDFYLSLLLLMGVQNTSMVSRWNLVKCIKENNT